ncbi:Asp23/Gls24 family envelope stress response protein [Bacillus horti]|uniref:Alkaline shock family protein YloU n=1 Tax=Caldalkalibacillus horti TaxID=77523 RepID=A0ABT9W1D8_9BACI|nr:Asp23/Gls24 family envelope stress response protein [Bacillus horti]MDQ0166877.1 putative alkaline shock family protein YloU [Bacillus horti]
METSFPQFEQTSELGKVEIAPEVIEVIAGLAASEIEGVAFMSGGFVGGIAERLGRKNLAKGVKVELGETQTVIDVSIVVEFGVRIPDVATAVQENVNSAIQNMTGLDVIEVNVHVVSVHVKQGEEGK